MIYNDSRLNNKVLVWVEFTYLEANLDDYNASIGMTRYEGLSHGIEQWSRITDTFAINVNSKNFPELVDLLVADFPHLTFIPAMKTAPYTGGGGSNDFFNPTKWADAAPVISTLAEKSGQSTILFDTETATNDYRNLTYQEFLAQEFDAEGLATGLASLPTDIDYIWYRSSFAGSETDYNNDAQMFKDIFEIAYNTLGCSGVSANETHPYSRNLIWQQMIAEDIETIAPKSTWSPMVFFLSSVLRPPNMGYSPNSFWISPYLDVDELYVNIDDYQRMLLYPGAGDGVEFVLDSHQLVDSIFNTTMPVEMTASIATRFGEVEFSLTNSATGAYRTTWEVVGPSGTNIYYSGQNPSTDSEVLDASQVGSIKLNLPTDEYQVRVRQEFTE